MKKWCAVLLLMYIVMCSLAQAEEALVEYQGVVWYTVQDGQSILDAMAADDSLSVSENELKEEAAQILADQVIFTLKYQELGLDVLSEEDDEILSAQTQAAYEANLEQLA